jgi:Mg/Co/Ni transporter MgtE
MLTDKDLVEKMASKGSGTEKIDSAIKLFTSPIGIGFIEALPADKIVDFLTKENTPAGKAMASLTGMNKSELELLLKGTPETAKALLVHIVSQPDAKQTLKKILNNEPGTAIDVINIITSGPGKKFIESLPADKLAALATKENSPIAKALQNLIGMDSKELKDLIGNSPEASKELIKHLLEQPDALKRIANKDSKAKDDVIDLLTSEAGKIFIDSLPANKLASLCTKENTPIALALQNLTGMDNKELGELISNSPEASKALIQHMLKDPQALKRIANKDPSAAQDVVNILTSKECKEFVNSLSAESLSSLFTKENTPIALALQTVTGVDSKELKSLIGSSPDASKALISSVLDKKDFLDKAAQYTIDSKSANKDPKTLKKLEAQKLELQKEAVDIITSQEGIKFIESLSAKDFGKLCEKSPAISQKVSSTLGIPPESAEYLVASLAPAFKDVALGVLKEEKEILLNFLEQTTKDETRTNDLSKKNVDSFTQKLMETVAQNPEAIALIINRQSNVFGWPPGEKSTKDVMLAGITAKTIENVASTLADPKKLNKITSSLKELSESPKSTLAKIKFAVTCLSTFGIRKTLDLYRETKKVGEQRLQEAQSDPKYGAEFLKAAESKVKEVVARSRATSPEQSTQRTAVSLEITIGTKREREKAPTQATASPSGRVTEPSTMEVPASKRARIEPSSASQGAKTVTKDESPLSTTTPKTPSHTTPKPGEAAVSHEAAPEGKSEARKRAMSIRAAMVSGSSPTQVHSGASLPTAVPIVSKPDNNRGSGRG